MPGVGKVKNQIDTINALLYIIDSARWFSIVIALVVLVASILLIANTIQVAANQRRNETSIMRLVGASRWMTELPFMLEAVIAAAVGGLIATGVSRSANVRAQRRARRADEEGRDPESERERHPARRRRGPIVGIALSALTAFATLRLYVRL